MFLVVFGNFHFYLVLTLPSIARQVVACECCIGPVLGVRLGVRYFVARVALVGDVHLVGGQFWEFLVDFGPNFWLMLDFDWGNCLHNGCPRN